MEKREPSYTVGNINQDSYLGEQYRGSLLTKNTVCVCVCVCVCVLTAQQCLTLCEAVDCSCQAPLSTGFSRQEYWSGLPFPSPGDLPDPGIEPRSPTLQTDS